MTILISVVFLMLQILWFAIFARAIISWFPIDPQGPIVKALDARSRAGGAVTRTRSASSWKPTISSRDERGVR